MKAIDLFATIFKNLSQRKGRTIFTMSGVIIGCLAIFMIVSITNGLENYLTSSMSSLMDTTTLSIYPNYENNFDPNGSEQDSKYTSLGEEAIEELSVIPNVTNVFGRKNQYCMLKYKSKTTGLDLCSSDFSNISDGDILVGNVPDSDNEILLSYATAYELSITKREISNGVYFEYEKDPEMEERFKHLIGKKITAYLDIYSPDGTVSQSKPLKLKIVGIKDYNHGPNDWTNDVSEETVKKAIKLDTSLDKATLKTRLDSNNQLSVIVDSEDNLESVSKEIQLLGYYAQSPLDFVKETKSIMFAVKLILGFLAGISLLVASFGIINTMEMAIYERNKEIGVMKVLGCSLKDIKRLFIFEACTISGIGGAISILIGFLFNSIINLIARNIAPSLSGQAIENIASADISLILGILFFSILIGMFAGYKPSKKAVNIDVLSAIR